ncbi:MAG: hypothetical protein VXY41_02425, partial [Pseudomonadota bacterium]|nr:hypothetical protein [Pseudomonadota bacterium]
MKANKVNRSLARKSQSGSKSKPSKRSRSRFGFLFYWGLVAILWAGIGLAGLIFYYALDMPDTEGLWSVSRSPEVRLY